MRVRDVLSAAGLVLCIGMTCAAGPIEVIYTKIAGTPKAAVPGAVDLDGVPAATDFRAFEDLFISPDGTKWIIKGRTQQGSDLENILLLGSCTSGTRLVQEGNIIPGGGPDERYDFFGSGVGQWDQMGRFAFSARARGGATATAQRVLVFDGSMINFAFKQGDPIMGLTDLAPNPSGDEVFGNSVGSIHILNDGTIGSQDSTITGIHTSRRPAIMYNDVGFKQTGVSTFTGIDGMTVETWGSIDANGFYTTPDGLHWMALGRAASQATSADTLVRDNAAVLATGATIPGSTVVVDAVFAFKLMSNGMWYARGDVVGDNDWATKDGVVVAKTGDPIITGSGENWGAVFSAFAGNRFGEWVLAGTTDNADPGLNEVLVYNGTQVLVREGDQVDLDGDGTLDDAYIGRGTNTLTAFDANDLAITDNRVVYFFASLRNGAGVDLNSTPSFSTPNAFMRLKVAVPCPGDFNRSGGVSVQDIFDFLAAYFGGDPLADVNASCSNTVQDIFDFLAMYFGPCL